MYVVKHSRSHNLPVLRAHPEQNAGSKNTPPRFSMDLCTQAPRHRFAAIYSLGCQHLECSMQFWSRQLRKDTVEKSSWNQPGRDQVCTLGPIGQAEPSRTWSRFIHCLPDFIKGMQSCCLPNAEYWNYGDPSEDGMTQFQNRWSSFTGQGVSWNLLSQQWWCKWYKQV